MPLTGVQWNRLAFRGTQGRIKKRLPAFCLPAFHFERGSSGRLVNSYRYRASTTPAYFKPPV